ncbi:uncharacterized protein Tco025E_02358 [Trypanosoma conorhini]|uniref:Uncharacterized protein n=1 Tax=Trypanosoma conorhini TaxID=83891 RepID=A0A422Q5V6_9TRYP|nr:uncharacterized protein Tco025E_02358 [Trypanosoma conorhini]RNF25334.1 hypothetical protein Tco025E_02358 [Trypanosoma conorhini]
MGKFQLCVESTVREVNSLLLFHNVHPQVRADVQRRLQRLVLRVQDHLGTLVPGYCEAAEDVCAAVVRGVVDDTLRNVLPGVELALEEKRCAALEQRTRDLELELRKSEAQCRELEGTLERFRKAHQFMLRCYFREVLVLRYQLHDALWRRRRSHHLQPPSEPACLPPQEVLSRGTSFVLPDSGVQGAGDAVEPLRVSRNMSLSETAAEGSTPSGNGDAVAPPDTQSSVADGAAHEVASSAVAAKGAAAAQKTAASPVSGKPAPLFLELLRPSQPSAAAAPATVVHQATPKDTPKAAAKPTTRGKKSHTSAVKATPDGGVSHTRVATQTVPFLGDDSVDAIFDYERYIRQLNRLRRRGSGSSAESEVTAISAKKAALEKYRRQQASGLHFMQRQLMEARQRTPSAAWSRQRGKSRGLSTSDLRATASSMDPVREALLEDLTGIYRAVQQLQEQHFKDVMELQNAIESIELKVGIVLGFFETYVEEVGRLAAALAAEEDTVSSTLSGALTAEDDPYRRRVVMDYFTVAASTGALEESVPKEAGDKAIHELVMQQRRQQRREQISFWENNPVTLHARAAFAELQAAAMRRWEEAPHRRPRRTTIDMLPAILRGDPSNFSIFTSGSKSRSEHEEDVTSLPSLTQENKLRALVRLRMQRIAYRARHRGRLRQLAEAARMGKRGEELDRILREVSSHEQTVEWLTRAINRLLRDLGLSTADSVSERKFFAKNLAFSPYLCEPTGEGQGDAGNEVVYVPVPVNARDAGELCATLSSNQYGYVIFKNEVIPIANVKYHQPLGLHNAVEAFGGSRDAAARATAAAAGGRGPRRVVPFHGTVVDYYRGVQLGRPLGERQGPMYVFWDTEQGSFFVVEEEEEGVDAEGTPTRRAPLLLGRQGAQQKLERQRNVHFSTTLIAPPLPEPDSVVPAVSYASPRPAISPRAVSEVVPPPVITYSVEKKTPAPLLLEQQGRRELPPCFPTAPFTTRPAHPLIVEPNKEERELLRIESLSARRAAGGAKKETPSSSGAVTALARLKGAERQRQKEALALAQQTGRRNEAQKPSNEHFLRMRFPCIPSSLSPASE